MLSKNPTEPQAYPLAGATDGASVPVLDPNSGIEVASTGDGTVNDPAATDHRPPGIGDQDPLLELFG